MKNMQKLIFYLSYQGEYDQSSKLWDRVCSVHFFDQMGKSHISNMAGDRVLLFWLLAASYLSSTYLIHLCDISNGALRKIVANLKSKSHYKIF